MILTLTQTPNSKHNLETNSSALGGTCCSRPHLSLVRVRVGVRVRVRRNMLRQTSLECSMYTSTSRERMAESPTHQCPFAQCLLAFVRTYKRQITAAQKQSLKSVFRSHFHHQITDAVRRELFSVAARGEVQVQKMDISECINLLFHVVTAIITVSKT